jgi:hypothetical protein
VRSKRPVIIILDPLDPKDAAAAGNSRCNKTNRTKILLMVTISSDIDDVTVLGGGVNRKKSGGHQRWCPLLLLMRPLLLAGDGIGRRWTSIT